MINRHPIARSLYLIALLLAGCEVPTTTKSPQPQGQTGLPTCVMSLGGRNMTLEIADTDQRRETGLMNRESMPADHGMIFIFPQASPQGFWMKNTLINLDIVYLDSNAKVVSIHTMYAKDLKSVPSKGPAKYAIELNETIAKQLGLEEGQQLALPPEVKKVP